MKIINTQIKKIFLMILSFSLLLTTLFFALQNPRNKAETAQTSTSAGPAAPTENVTNTPLQTEVRIQEHSIFSAPISDWKNRIIKKPFGIKISPQNSPVQPERFSGYHTGTDFEIKPGELNTKVYVNAICDGEIIEKRLVSGYGGVFVQSCKFNEYPITVLYGHISFSNEFSPKKGEAIEKGQLLASLADDKSSESGGERKHLHLSIHKGEKIELRGYAQNKAALQTWIDPETLLSPN
jgi:hypothetical protein